MRWIFVPVVLLALGGLAACTEGKKQPPPSTGESSVIPTNVATQKSRVITSEGSNYGCLWSITFGTKLIQEEEDLIVTCDRLSANKRVYVSLDGRVPDTAGFSEGEQLLFRVEGPGLKEDVVAVFEPNRIQGGLKFLGKTKSVAVVPNNGIVPARVDLIGCVDTASRPFDCQLGEATLQILSNR